MTPLVLLTGGAGFIGTRLAAELSGAGLEVAMMDVLHPQVHPSSAPPVPDGTTLLPCDVTSAADWDAVLKVVRPTSIVHLAAETGTGQSLLEASRHARVNVEGTTQMMDALARNEMLPEQIVLTSSRAVYGEGRWQAASGAVHYPAGRAPEALEQQRWDPVGPHGEALSPLPSRADTTDPRPSNVYAATKLAQEHLLGAWCAALGVGLSVLRLQNVIGPGQSVGNPYTGVLTLFARVALSGGTIDIYEDGDIVRDFVFVDDVVAAIRRALERPTASRVCDIGSGRPGTIAEAARIIAGLAGAPEPRVSGRYRLGDVRAAFCDTEVSGTELGWAPSRGLEDSLPPLVDFVRGELAKDGVRS